MNENTYISAFINIISEPKIRCEFNPKQFRPGLVVGFDQKEIFGGGTGIYPHLSKNQNITGRPDKIYFGGAWADGIEKDQFLDFSVHSVGEGNHKRDVYVFDIPSKINLRAGLTIHSGHGTWSSWPMHTFEERAIMSPANLYPDFFEVFAFIADPVGGWGLQTVRSKSNVETRAICDRQIVDIPLSLHPVVGAPDVRIGYFWAYTNGGEKFTKEGRI